MILVKSPDVFAAVNAVAEHYNKNVANRFTNRALSTLALEPGAHVLIAELTQRYESYLQQGYHLDELYPQIMAMAHAIHQLRHFVLPGIRHLVYSDIPANSPPPTDKVIRDMIIANFKPNIDILAFKLNELYAKTVEIDEANAGKSPPVYRQFPQLQTLDDLILK